MVLEKLRHASIRNLEEKQWMLPCLFYIGLVCVHIAMACYVNGPRIFADELGYLGNARYMTGTGVLPNMAGTVFYHAGYSLLISPGFFASSDPESVYFFVLVLNSFLISTLFLFLYYWLINVFLFDQKTSVLAALVVSLYPSFLLHSNTAWAENAIIPLFILPSILLYLTMKRKTLLLGIGFGLSVSFLYTVHPRILPLLVVAILYLFYLGFLRFLSVRIVAGSLSSLAIGLFATLELHHHLRFLGWEGGGSSLFSLALSRFTLVAGGIKFLQGAAGQVWYLTGSTYGLFLIGCVVLGSKLCRNLSSLKKETDDSAQTHALLFCGLSSVGIFCVSVLFLSSFKWNAERPIYGRYNECFLAALVAPALAAMLAGEHEGRWRKWLIPAVLVPFCGLGLATSLIDVNQVKQFSLIPQNVHGLFPVLGGFVHVLGFSFTSAVLISTLFFVLSILFLVWAFQSHRVFGVVSLSLLFLTMAASQYLVLYLHKGGNSLILPGVIRSVPDIETVSFDRSSQGWREFYQFYQYQFLLPHHRFLLFSSSKGQYPKSDVFLTSGVSEFPSRIGARLLSLEKGTDLALWTKKGPDRTP